MLSIVDNHTTTVARDNDTSIYIQYYWTSEILHLSERTKHIFLNSETFISYILLFTVLQVLWHEHDENKSSSLKYTSQNDIWLFSKRFFLFLEKSLLVVVQSLQFLLAKMKIFKWVF